VVGEAFVRVAVVADRAVRAGEGGELAGGIVRKAPGPAGRIGDGGELVLVVGQPDAGAEVVLDGNEAAFDVRGQGLLQGEVNLAQLDALAVQDPDMPAGK